MSDDDGNLLPDDHIAGERRCVTCGGRLPDSYPEDVCGLCAYLAAHEETPASGHMTNRPRPEAASPDGRLLQSSWRIQEGECAGYTLEIVAGDQVTLPPALALDELGSPSWLARVFCPQPRLVVELYGFPGGRERLVVTGEPPATRADQDVAAQRSAAALRLIRHFKVRGRPPGRTNLTREEFLTMYADARRQCLADGFPPTDDNLVRFLPISKATLIRYRRRWLPDITDHS